MPLKTLVVEDSLEQREAIVKQASINPHIQVVATFAGVEETVEYLVGSPVDLVFLDISIEGGYGFDILAELRRRSLPLPAVVVVTGETERGKAEILFNNYKQEIVGYLFKPMGVNWKEIQKQVVKEAYEHQQTRAVEALKLKYPEAGTWTQLEMRKSNGARSYAAIGDILYFQTIKDRGVCFHFTDGRPPYTETKHIQKKLLTNFVEKVFCEISRNTVVNLHHVETINGNATDGGKVYLKGGPKEGLICKKDRFGGLLKGMRELG